MSIMGLLLFLIIAGIAIGMVPIEATIKRIIIALVCIVAVVWVFGIMGWVSTPVFVR